MSIDIKGMEFEDTTDDDGDMAVVLHGEVALLDRDDAILIIDHFREVFDL